MILVTDGEKYYFKSYLENYYVSMVDALNFVAHKKFDEVDFELTFDNFEDIHQALISDINELNSINELLGEKFDKIPKHEDIKLDLEEILKSSIDENGVIDHRKLVDGFVLSYFKKDLIKHHPTSNQLEIIFNYLEEQLEQGKLGSLTGRLSTDLEYFPKREGKDIKIFEDVTLALGLLENTAKYEESINRKMDYDEMLKLLKFVIDIYTVKSDEYSTLNEEEVSANSRTKKVYDYIEVYQEEKRL